jgi:hypothetical protein
MIFNQTNRLVIQTVFHYDLDGLLLAETTEASNLIRVYFWAEDAPIAQMDTELTYLRRPSQYPADWHQQQRHLSCGNGTAMPSAVCRQTKTPIEMARKPL